MPACTTAGAGDEATGKVADAGAPKAKTAAEQSQDSTAKAGAAGGDAATRNGTQAPSAAGADAAQALNGTQAADMDGKRRHPLSKCGPVFWWCWLRGRVDPAREGPASRAGTCLAHEAGSLPLAVVALLPSLGRAAAGRALLGPRIGCKRRGSKDRPPQSHASHFKTPFDPAAKALPFFCARPALHSLLRLSPPGRERMLPLAKDGYLVVTWANWHYRDFVRNWVAQLNRTGCTAYVVGAMDDALYDDLEAKGIPTFLMASGLPTTDFGWGSKVFFQMVGGAGGARG